MKNQSSSDNEDEDLTPRTYREHNWLSRPTFPKSLPDDVRTWRINHVLDWLGTHVCLPEYKTQFARLSVDGMSLLTLNNYLLKNEFQIESEVHCTKIEQHILALKDGRRADHTNWDQQSLGHGLVPETESVNAPRYNSSPQISPRLQPHLEEGGPQQLSVTFPESELLDGVGPMLKNSVGPGRSHDGSSTYLQGECRPLSRNASSKSHVPADYLYPFAATVTGPGSPFDPNVRGSKFIDNPKPTTYFPVNGPAVLMKNNRVNLESWRWSGGSFEVDTGGQIISINDNKTGKGGDVILGVWTCCQSVDPLAPPCHSYKRGHTALESKCINCGIFFRLKDGYPKPCRYHAASEPSVVNAFGAVMWACCQTYGLKDSKYVLDRNGTNHQRHGCRQGSHVPEFPPTPEGGSCTRCGKTGIKDTLGWKETCKRHPGLFCLYRRIRRITHSDAQVKKVFVQEKDVYPLPPDMMNIQGDVDQACQMIPPDPIDSQPDPVKIRMRKIIMPPFCPLTREQVFGKKTVQTVPGPLPHPLPPRKVNQAVVIPPLEPLDLDPHLIGEDVISPELIVPQTPGTPWDPMKSIPAITCPPSRRTSKIQEPSFTSNQSPDVSESEGTDENEDQDGFNILIEDVGPADQSAAPPTGVNVNVEMHITSDHRPSPPPQQPEEGMGSRRAHRKLSPNHRGRQQNNPQVPGGYASFSSEAVLVSSTQTLRFSSSDESGLQMLETPDANLKRPVRPVSPTAMRHLLEEVDRLEEAEVKVDNDGKALAPEPPKLLPDLRKHVLTNQVVPGPEPSNPPPNLAKYRFTEPPEPIMAPSVPPRSNHFEGICSLDPPYQRPTRTMVPPRIYIKAAVYPPKPQNIQPPTKAPEYRTWQYEMRHEVPPNGLTPSEPPPRMGRMMVNAPQVAEDVAPNFPVCDFHCLRRTYNQRMVSVFNRSTRPITVHPARHFAESPKSLVFDREYAWGFRLRAKTVFPPRGNKDVELILAEQDVPSKGPMRSRQMMVPVSFLWKDPDSVSSRKIRHLLAEHCGPLKYFPETPNDDMHVLEKKSVHQNPSSMKDFNADTLVANPKASVKDMRASRAHRHCGSFSHHLGRLNLKKVELAKDKKKERRRTQLNRARPPSSLAKTAPASHHNFMQPSSPSPIRVSRAASAPSVGGIQSLGARTLPYNELGRVNVGEEPQMQGLRLKGDPEAMTSASIKKDRPRISRTGSGTSMATEFVGFNAGRPRGSASHRDRDDFTVHTDEYGARPLTARSYDTNFEWQPETRSNSALMIRQESGDMQDPMEMSPFPMDGTLQSSGGFRPYSADLKTRSGEYLGPATPPQQPAPPSASSTGRLRSGRQSSNARKFRPKGWKDEGFFSGPAGYSPSDSFAETRAHAFSADDIHMPPLDLGGVASPIDKQLLQQELDKLLRRGTPRTPQPQTPSSRKESTTWRDEVVEATADWSSKNMFPDGTLHKFADTRQIESERIRVKRTGKNKFRVLGNNPRTVHQPSNDSWLLGLH